MDDLDPTASEHRRQREPEVNRRTVVAGTGLLAAAAVATVATACGGREGAPGDAAGPATPAGPSAPPPARTPLGSASAIPVGGGQVFPEQKVVVTQPSPGSYQGFSAVCPHQGCTVNAVANGTIDCPCHGSTFAIADGAVVRGPATTPLPPRPVSVEGDTVVLG